MDIEYEQLTEYRQISKNVFVHTNESIEMLNNHVAPATTQKCVWLIQMKPLQSNVEISS